MQRQELRQAWCRIDASAHVWGPVVYQLRISTALYVGRALNVMARFRQYEGNLCAMLAGRPYHNQGRDFRAVHHAMLEAYRDLVPVELSVLETCSPEQLKEREDFWLARRRQEEAAGGLRVLNVR